MRKGEYCWVWFTVGNLLHSGNRTEGLAPNPDTSIASQNCEGLKSLPVGEDRSIQLLSCTFQAAIQEYEEPVKVFL